MKPSSNHKKFTWAGVKSNEGRASFSLLCAHTQESPRPSHAADPATTSAVTKENRQLMKIKFLNVLLQSFRLLQF
jgi:hypothetical protein